MIVEKSTDIKKRQRELRNREILMLVPAAFFFFFSSKMPEKGKD